MTVYSLVETQTGYTAQKRVWLALGQLASPRNRIAWHVVQSLHENETCGQIAGLMPSGWDLIGMYSVKLFHNKSWFIVVGGRTRWKDCSIFITVGIICIYPGVCIHTGGIKSSSTWFATYLVYMHSNTTPWYVSKRSETSMQNITSTGWPSVI